MSLTRYLVTLVKNYPATWGYYVADEPSSGDYGAVANLSSTIHTTDPNHPRLIIKLDALTNSNAGNVGNLAQFTPLAEVVGEDWYPISYNQNIGATGSIASAVQGVANSHGRNSAMVLEVNSGNSSDYIHATQYPSLTDMEVMLTMTLQNSQPRLVLWYWAPGLSDGQWNNLVTASKYPFQGQGTYHQCSQTNGGCAMNYPYFTDLTIVKSPDGSGGYNYSCTNPQTASIGECMYPANVSCSNHGGLAQQYSQCSRTVGGCAYDFASGVVLQVQHCKDGTYICPANLAKVIPGQCGIPGPTLTPTSVPTPTSASTPTPTSVPAFTPTPTPTPSTGSGSPTPTPSQGASPTPTGAAIQGDIDHDGVVDIVDYRLLMACFGDKFKTPSCTAGSAADLNGDGLVDGIDYNILLRAMIGNQ